jgi:uncharacterized membrane protein YbhN (UPF0104 family)
MTSSATSESDRRQIYRGARWRQLALVGVLVASLAYLGSIAWQDLDSFLVVFRSLQPWALACAATAALAMMLLKAVYHHDLCRALAERPIRAEALLRAYTTGQVVRYLPGKIWGVVYQAARVDDVTPDRIVTANVMQMVHTNLLAVGVIGAVLGSVLLERYWPLGLLVPTLVLVELLHRRPTLEAALVRAANRLLRRPNAASVKVDARPWRGSAILVLEWVAYYAMWWALLFPTGLIDMLVPSTWYAAASLLAILAFVVPGGIGVREALFVTLASGFSLGAASLVAIAAAMRLVLVLAELVCIPVSTWVGRIIDGGGR